MAGYNGWANYETWNVGLWFLDDMVSVASDNGKPIDADWCKEFIEEYLDNEHSDFHVGFIGDVMQSFIRSVDWREIASHVNDDAELTDEDEDEDAE